MASIKFLIDSSADIPADLLEGTGIEVLHFPIVVDGREYFDGQDFTPQEFYQILARAKAIPTHSQLTPFFFVEQYEKAFSEGCDELIYTSINSKGSATNQNANQAIDMFFEEHPEARDKLRITVIDSKTYTMAYGYIVLEAAKAVKNGATADEAIAMIRDWLDHVRVLFTPYDLKYAKKSGRISAAAAVLGDALGIHPIMSFPNGDSKVLAKVRGLKNEGASGWMWTSNYAYPVTTITKDVRTDMLAIPEVLGVKIALGDHRSSFPNQHEIMQILADIRVSGMLTGKTGFLHVHLGDFAYSFDIFDECIAQGMPIKHIRPTHVARHPEVFRRACEFAKKGGFIDITTGGGNYMGSAADAVRAALAADVPFDRITLSSDGHGSMPRFNEAGEMVGLGIGSIMCDIETIRELKDELGIEKALTPMTKTVAGALGLESKGGIAVGKDADLLFLTKDFDINWVFMMGKVAMRQGEVVMKGAFEE